MTVTKGLEFRKKFIELAEAIFRELGFPPPEMFHDDHLPLAMELNHAGNDFELLHSSSEMPERILVCCFLGSLPEENTSIGMQRLLEANLTLVRSHEAAYGLRSEENKVCCMYYEALETTSVRPMMEKMKRIAEDSKIWNENFFSPRGLSVEAHLLGNRIGLA